MSYILDALKKADQQRQRTAPPTLRSAPAVVPETKKPPASRYALPILALIVIAVIVGWLQMRPPATSSAPDTATVATTTQVTPSRVPPAVPASQLAPSIPSMPAPPLPLPNETSATAPSRSPAASAAAAPVADMPVTAEPQPSRLLAMDDLPLAVRQSLPEMAISLHAWSATPKSRLVSINNQVMHEGDTPAPGVTLEEITPDGMIMSFHGYRFRRGVR